jgi:hypothetical protein
VRRAAVVALPKEAVEMLPSIDKLAPNADWHQALAR